MGAKGHAVVKLPMLWRYGARYSLILGWTDVELWKSATEVGKLMGPRVLGAGVVQLMFIANTVIASYYHLSVLAALNYAWIVMLLPNGIFASSIATAIFPTFSRMAVVGNQAGMRSGLTQTLRALLFVVVPSAVGLVMLRVPIIQFLFERKEFTQETTLAVAWALGFYGFGLIAHSLIEVISRAYFALQDTFTPVIIGGITITANIVLSLLLIPVVGDASCFTAEAAKALQPPACFVVGPQGALALANTIASTAEVFILLWFLRSKLGGIEVGKLLDSTIRLLLAAGAMAGALWGLSQSAFFTELPIIIVTPLAIIIGAAVYFVCTLLLRVDEATMVPRMILRRRG